MTAKEIEELAGHRQVPAWVVKLVGDAIAATKKEWVGLTQEEIKLIWKESPHIVGLYTYTDIAEQVEAKLKEKNK